MGLFTLGVYARRTLTLQTLTHCSSVIVINKLTIIMADTVETTTTTPAEETTPAVETTKPEADVAVKETESTNGTSTENGKAEEVKETNGTSEEDKEAEAVKRKSDDTESGDATQEKIIKLKEAASEKVSEAMPSEPANEEEAKKPEVTA